MDENRDLQPHNIGSQATSAPTALVLSHLVGEPAVQMQAHTRWRRAKRPSTCRSAAIADNCPVQKHELRYDLKHQGQINKAAAAFGAILYTVVTGDSIVTALTNIISRALNTNV
jgi:hypothetical protein